MERSGGIFRNMRNKPWFGTSRVADGSFEEVETGAIDFDRQGELFHESI